MSVGHHTSPALRADPELGADDGDLTDMLVDDGPPPGWGRIRTVLKDRWFAAGGAVLLAIIFIVAFLVPLIVPLDPLAQEIQDRFEAPSADHWFGTDTFGRDVLSRVVVGARVSVTVGLSVAILAGLIGSALGLISGYFLGWTDRLINRTSDAFMTIPGILMAIGLLAVLGPGVGNVILVLTIAYIPVMARVARGLAISLRSRGYVRAARAVGAKHGRILVRHVLPHALGPIIVQATIIFAYAILYEAALSYLGLGVRAPNPSLGNIINEGQSTLYNAPWIALFPGVVISLTVLSINLLGDGLRDLVDPQLR